MVDVTLSDRIVTLTSAQLASMPVELVIAKTAGTMAALLQLDITAQGAAMSQQNIKVQKLMVLLSKCRELQKDGKTFASVQSNPVDTSLFGNTNYNQLLGEVGITGFKTGATNNTDWQSNISLVESALDNANTLSQDQNIRLQTLKGKYDQMYKLISGFEGSSKEVAMGIIQKIG